MHRSFIKRRSYTRDLFATILIAAIVLAVISLFVNVLTGLPYITGWNTAVLGVISVLVTLFVARTAHKIQQEIRSFLMGKVNSRTERTAAVIDMCQKADHIFCAATFFPAVGVRDEPSCKPMEYLRAVEDALTKGVKVQLVSVSFQEAKKHCSGHDEFSSACVDALEDVAMRFQELEKRSEERHFDGILERIEIPEKQLTLNLCYNDSAALIYHMSLDGQDDGAGFKSADERIRRVAEGGFKRYLDIDGPDEIAMAVVERSFWVRLVNRLSTAVLQRRLGTAPS